ncbi:MAG TPA: hypothetical protein VJ762_14895 [Sphingobium sp.]|nr:hypothetical protein [Sphingobium sp.]
MDKAFMTVSFPVIVTVIAPASCAKEDRAYIPSANALALALS